MAIETYRLMDLCDHAILTYNQLDIKIFSNPLKRFNKFNLCRIQRTEDNLKIGLSSEVYKVLKQISLLNSFELRIIKSRLMRAFEHKYLGLVRKNDILKIWLCLT